MAFATEYNAQSHETSIEIMRAIESIAHSDQDAERIWQSPTDHEVEQIREHVTADGSVADDYCWGAAGSIWL